nr:tyrosine-protein phosphatase [Rubricella aquisinus]
MSFGSLPLEVEACDAHGLTFIIYRLYSRDLPPRDELLGFIDLIKSVETPVLYHCKSGADRAGLAAALHMHFVEGQEVEAARAQLSFKYLHLRHAKTGVLDAFFDAYLTARGDSDLDLRTWIETAYDPQAIKAEFLSSRKLGLAWLVDKVLRRE